MKKDAAERSDSIVGRNTVVEGDVRGAENLTIDGTVKGSLRIEGKVLIGETGVVEADIEAKSVVVKGRVTGDVTARNELEVHPGGELYGMIRARLIHIREGAIFEGRSQMIRSTSGDGAPARKPSAVPEPAADTVLTGKAGMVSG